jgi:hypothetical protein
MMMLEYDVLLLLLLDFMEVVVDESTSSVMKGGDSSLRVEVLAASVGVVVVVAERGTLFFNKK